MAQPNVECLWTFTSVPTLKWGAIKNRFLLPIHPFHFLVLTFCRQTCVNFWQWRIQPRLHPFQVDTRHPSMLSSHPSPSHFASTYSWEREKGGSSNVLIQHEQKHVKKRDRLAYLLQPVWSKKIQDNNVVSHPPPSQIKHTLSKPRKIQYLHTEIEKPTLRTYSHRQHTRIRAHRQKKICLVFFKQESNLTSFKETKNSS